MINETLLMALKEQIKVTLSVSGVDFPFYNCIINKITEDHIKFTIPITDVEKEYLKVYIFDKNFIVGIGYVIAELELPPEDDDNINLICD